MSLRAPPRAVAQGPGWRNPGGCTSPETWRQGRAWGATWGACRSLPFLRLEEAEFRAMGVCDAPVGWALSMEEKHPLGPTPDGAAIEWEWQAWVHTRGTRPVCVLGLCGSDRRRVLPHSLEAGSPRVRRWRGPHPPMSSQSSSTPVCPNVMRTPAIGC